MTDQPSPPDKPKSKRGGSKPGRTRAAAALVVADREARRGKRPGDEVHEGEFTEAKARPAEAPSSEDRARAILNRVKHAGGRPLELTRDVITRTVKAVLDGASPKLALKAQGFSDFSYLEWRRRAKEDLAKDPPELTIYAEFSLSIDAALGEFGQEAAEWLSRNRDTPAGKLSAGNVTFLLGRRYADEYGQKQALEVTGKDGGPVEVKDARAEAFARIAAAVGPDASLFLAEMKRWPSSVEEVEAWRARRQAAAPGAADVEP